MRLYQVLRDGKVINEYTSLPEAVREAVIAGSLELVEVDQPEPDRRYSMSLFPAPADYRWHHEEMGEQDGDGLVHVNNDETRQLHRRIRREWLRQFPLSVSQSPENGYRHWRWTDPSSGKVVWHERRPWDDPLPHEPGFWPAN